MGYLIDFEHELRDLLAAGDIEAAVSYAKKKLLESYYNTPTKKTSQPARRRPRAAYN